MSADLEEALRFEVKECLLDADLSQADVARALGLSTKHVSQMLTGRATLSLYWADEIVKLCDRELLIISRRWLTRERSPYV